MIKIALTLVHNKNNAQNIQQIIDLNNLLTQVFDTMDTENGPKQVPTGIYKFNGISVEHEVRLYQVIPFGGRIPSNIDLLNSYKVYYGVGDENKTGDHPRFFNWSLKRGTDHGAEISIQLVDVSTLNVSDLMSRLRNDRVEFIETQYGRFGNLRLLKEIGQLKEDRSITNSITELRSRIG